jgi:hypothetical protein
VPERPHILLADANVLIDYRDADLSILRSACVHVGPIRVVREVLDEVADFDADQASSLGIDVVDAGAELLLEVATLPRRLSRPDRLSYLVARENDWICLTNDRLLRELCAENGVRLCWGLKIMELLVEADVLVLDVAAATARTIVANNPQMGEAVLSTFLRRIGRI